MPRTPAKKKAPVRQPASGGMQRSAASPPKPEGGARPAIQREKAATTRSRIAQAAREAAHQRQVGRFLSTAPKKYSALFERAGVKNYFAGMGMTPAQAEMLFADVGTRMRISPKRMLKMLNSILASPQKRQDFHGLITQRPYSWLRSFFKHMKKQVPEPRHG